MKLLAICMTMTVASAHSWIDCIDHDRAAVYDRSSKWIYGGKGGHGVCEGYARKYPGRGTSTINTEFTYKIHHQQVLDGHAVCQAESRENSYNSWRKIIHAKPGDTLYFAYLPNGHISKDKQARDTKYGIYWSGKPNKDLTSTKELTPDRLVNGNLQKFDDFNCGETWEDGYYGGGSIRSGRAGDGKPCVGSLTIPSNTASGTYQFVWFWTFYNTDAKQVIEYGYYGAAYSSCFDVQVEGIPSPTKKPKSQSTPKTTPHYKRPAPKAKKKKSTTKKHKRTKKPRKTTTKKAPLPKTSIATIRENVQAAVTVTNVGGTGSYGRVVEMEPGIFGQACPSNKCRQVNHPVGGSLAPFNEEMSVAFRGPMTIYNIGVYEPGDDHRWQRVSMYDKSARSSKNLVFMNNQGDGKKSGIWTTCGGNSESYATADGKHASSKPQQFSGYLKGSTEVHIMSGAHCKNQEDCGFYRPEGLHGWKGRRGGQKMFIIKAKMPHGLGSNLPSIWMLNAQIVRTAQYGCNCRGMGDNGPWKGGCGEFDVAEVIPANQNKLTSTIYSFKGSRGAGEYSDRPTNRAATFVVIFDSSEGGIIKVIMLGENDVAFEQTIQKSRVRNWLNISGKHVNFNM